MELPKDCVHPLISVALDQVARTAQRLELKRIELNLDPDSEPVDKHMIEVEIEANHLLTQLVLDYLADRGVLEEFV